ncbi:MAG: MarR family transcriptional regulator [Rhodospirillaceae bacterium]|nr:MarR family transcriptional regulator [Rhodospirillaceae bacterium]MBT5564680.1 MarR family transcriptional regulator [Rhodospirillaceae bacterium]MBT7451070.1 MarR family transcriptional regulator [Rhodospirillaceae bacterium]
MAIRRQDALGYQIGLLSRLFDRVLEAELSAFGVLPGQFPALVMLYQKDGLTQAELCQRINVEQPTMANTLNRMERDDLIRRVPDPDDKRRTHIHLTDRAKAFKTDLMEKARQVPSQAMHGMDSADQDRVFHLIGRMIDNLKVADD